MVRGVDSGAVRMNGRFRDWGFGGALVVALLVQTPVRAAPPGPAARAGAAGGESRCAGEARGALTRLPLVHAAQRRILRRLAVKRYAEAARAARAAVATYRDPWAAYALGQLYSQGLGVKRDPRRAVRWYRWAAQHGSMRAARELANAYLHGTGTRRNAARAAYWFREGVAPKQLAGSAAALAAKYAAGAFMPRNPGMARYYEEQSVRILRRLVRQPNGPAEFALGSAYADGRGVPRSRPKALAHLCRALRLGYEAAAPRIVRLEEVR